MRPRYRHYEFRACVAGDREIIVTHKLIYHIVSETKDRAPAIAGTLRPDLHNYMGGIISNLKDVPIEINDVEDYVHALEILSPTIALLTSARIFSVSIYAEQQLSALNEFSLIV